MPKLLRELAGQEAPPEVGYPVAAALDIEDRMAARRF
jgi:hypothetical protein